MALHDEINAELGQILGRPWKERDGQKVPDSADVELGNDGVALDAAVLYADLADSTGLVSRTKRTFAAEVFKAYLRGACKILRAKDGNITSFDGDRVMAVFVGANKETSAVRAALAVNHLVEKVLNPLVKQRYTTDFVARHAVGVASGTLFVARAGIRGSNDLVWVGPAANVAAKLSALREAPFATFITDDVYRKMSDEVRMAKSGPNMWESRTWSERSVYRSSYHWPL
jgi:class 3 adenylate cyclase